MVDGPHSQMGSVPFDLAAAAHPVPQFPHLVAIVRGVFLTLASLKQLRGRQAGQTVAPQRGGGSIWVISVEPVLHP